MKRVMAVCLLLVLSISLVVAVEVSSELEEQFGGLDLEGMSEEEIQNSAIGIIEDNPELVFEILADNISPETKAKIKTIFFIIVLIALFELIMKGLAMWKASKKDSRVWFWVLLVLNTAGILPLLYLIFSKNSNKVKKK